MTDVKAPASVSRLKSFLVNSLLAICSTALAFVGLECFLWAWDATHVIPPEPPAAATPAPAANDLGPDIQVPPDVAALAESRLKLLTMPDAWKHTPTQVAGATRAEYWHGVLHVYNSDNLRRIEPFPEKRGDTYRVMVVGDSLTDGYGLAEQWRFSNLLEQSMGRQFRIEFLNLGREGDQSEDVLGIVKKYLPTLKPNLVIYAACLNDFLPSGVGQYATPTAYPFPLPDNVKTFLIRNTRTGAFLSEAYDAALRRLHLRTDFFDDILADFRGYQQRFARDVIDMNNTVQAAGLPPLVSIVLDQFPYLNSRGYRIAMVAEAALQQSGATVIPTEDFYRRYSGRPMHVSPWEGHPNEVANIIWANMIALALAERDDLRAFKKSH